MVTGAREEDVEVPKHSDLSDQAGLPHLILNQTLLPHHCFFCGFSLMDLGEFARESQAMGVKSSLCFVWKISVLV